jgi:Do/DeqQ family serine protease
MLFRKGFLFSAALVVFVAGMLFLSGCTANSKTGGNAGGALPVKQSATTASPMGTDTIANIASQAGPAVVKIDTVLVSKSTTNNPLFNDPFFRQFFGRVPLPAQPKVEHGIGSGFIISRDGYILTNDHVIHGAEKVTVSLQGRTEPLPAVVVGSDYDLDLAVLKVNAGDSLQALTLGDSGKMQVGDWVVAIGNPYGLDHTVTVGVISAKGRPVTIGNRHYKNLLQTDASINPGNSGGPLLNLNGEVIGINTAVAEQAQGIGFAIPTSTVQQVLDQLMKGEKVAHPWLGVQIMPLDQQLAKELGLSSTDGALVVGVVPESPAANAGLQQGDVIVKFGGQTVKTPDDLTNFIAASKAGQQVVLTIYRSGQPHTLNVTIGQEPGH